MRDSSDTAGSADCGMVASGAVRGGAVISGVDGLWGRAALVVMGLVSALGLAGCSGGSDAAVPPTVLLTTTTTAPTTTTTEPTTTTTEDPNLAEIRAVYEEYFQYLPTYGITVDEEVLEQFAADPLLTRATERLSLYEAESYQMGRAEYDIHILGIEIEGSSAVVTSCDLDAVSLLDKNGEEIIPADDFRYLRTTELQLLDQGWRITDSGLGEEKTVCEDS